MRFTFPSGLLSLVIILFGSLAIISCGSGGGGGGTTVSEPLVSDTIKTVNTLDTVSDAEIEIEPNGRRIARTKMMIVFKPTATAQEMDELLASLNATITMSLAGTRSVVVRIPDPGSLDAYQTIVFSVEAEPYIDFVWQGEMSQPLELPDNFTGDPADPAELEYIKNHLAIRGPAAWNLRGAINNDPNVLIVDFFGNGPPINNTVDINNMGGFLSNPGADAHGYHVLGIMAARFGVDFIAGVYPSTINLHVIDLTAGMDIPTSMLHIIDQVGNIPGKIVVNTSLGYNCNGAGGNCIKIEDAEQYAMLWIEYNRLFGLENRVLYVAAAGNIENPPGADIRDAATSYFISSGGLLGGLVDYVGTHIPNLSNTIVVENGWSYDPSLWVITKPKCLSEWSFVGGNLMGIGEEVWSYVDASGTVGSKSGTSMATPQVAGVAAYLWAVEPNLTPQQIIEILTKTGVPVLASQDIGCSDWATPAPAVNAYEALLSIDAAADPTPANSPVRHELLDVNGDGSFDESDLEDFVSQYYGSLDAKELIVPAGEEYGRYDLNADGYDGGPAPDYSDKFDLDRSGSQQYGQATYANASFVINDTEVELNEQSLTDMDIVCYYAYSDLYTGDTDARDDLLEIRCNVLSTLRAELPCTAAGAEDINCQTISTDSQYSYLSGIENTSYDVTIRVRGVVEQKAYAGSTEVDGMWANGGTPDGGSFNIYKLQISSPLQTYYLNFGSSGIDRCFAIDFTKTIIIDDGAEVRLLADAGGDGYQTLNQDSEGGLSLVIPDIPPAPSAFNGQFIQMDVVSVVER